VTLMGIGRNRQSRRKYQGEALRRVEIKMERARERSLAKRARKESARGVTMRKD